MSEYFSFHRQMYWYLFEYLTQCHTWYTRNRIPYLGVFHAHRWLNMLERQCHHYQVELWMNTQQRQSEPLIPVMQSHALH